MALIFMVTSFLCISVITMAIPFVSQNRSVYDREYVSTMYSSVAHALSLAVVEFVYCIGLSMLFLTCFNWFCGLSTTNEAWMWFWVSLVVSMALWSYQGHLLVYALPTMQVAVLMGGGLSALLFESSGFMIDGNALSEGWQWAYWVSPVHYMLEIILTTQVQAVQAFSFDNVGRDMAILWALILALQGMLLYCMTKVNHTTR
ncbi:hypothetical protein H310_02390 [Aphanomyces invadans]|uniref:ABC-2 type transporter transmembrane domain-containing protein n=1 Tax=Aphanomyces invadans TaxID=157072 RepID=A0A024UQA6_9STRA|nr:hypothetical protein H310_02390 [Aphanomyces invadans]ETW08012.1 hypothetical protein H310_02390 [Aphanomyces invadans]|eukprot:XP_008864105.1 hypothetical protein H310_02390 [Aphanomyces invadans]